jgi:hypothetical protein
MLTPLPYCIPHIGFQYDNHHKGKLHMTNYKILATVRYHLSFRPQTISIRIFSKCLTSDVILFEWRQSHWKYITVPCLINTAIKWTPKLWAITATKQLQKWRTEQRTSMEVMTMQHLLMRKYTAQYSCHISQKSSNYICSLHILLQH